MLKDIYITFHDPIWTVALFVALYFPLKKILLNLYLRKHFKEKGLGKIKLIQITQWQKLG